MKYRISLFIVLFILFFINFGNAQENDDMYFSREDRQVLNDTEEFASTLIDDFSSEISTNLINKNTSYPVSKQNLNENNSTFYPYKNINSYYPYKYNSQIYSNYGINNRCGNTSFTSSYSPNSGGYTPYLVNVNYDFKDNNTRKEIVRSRSRNSRSTTRLLSKELNKANPEFKSYHNITTGEGSANNVKNINTVNRKSTTTRTHRNSTLNNYSSRPASSPSTKPIRSSRTTSRRGR